MVFLSTLFLSRPKWVSLLENPGDSSDKVAFELIGSGNLGLRKFYHIAQKIRPKKLTSPYKCQTDGFSNPVVDKITLVKI
jgi:hypothetical protein